MKITLQAQIKNLNGRSEWHDVLVPDWDYQVRLDEILGKPPNLRPFRAAELNGIPHEQVRFWCWEEAVWQLPSVELLRHLERLIGGRKAIEIGAGWGHIGRLLGIPPTDSHQQATPWFGQYAGERGQKTIIEFPSDVQQLEAGAAIREHRPEVVVGCWVTHRFEHDDKRTDGGFTYGVDESAIVSAITAGRRVRRYIMAGNNNVHGKKPILRKPHMTIPDAAIVSRARERSLDRIWVWGKE